MVILYLILKVRGLVLSPTPFDFINRKELHTATILVIHQFMLIKSVSLYHILTRYIPCVHLYYALAQPLQRANLS
ncbi:hypothetical protein VCR26J2_180002 [Vibrio coralliirubri]|nr:hypothetical protein VCR6J2_450002 [Vibrio coralliirubri]CDT51576.1 hypothetical protein VCR26J2_180002 [Vibrio coralliirubri]CDT99819.1 hypothetical protein VCR8J2_60198 [Vibrio coralliirubri]